MAKKNLNKPMVQVTTQVATYIANLAKLANRNPAL